MPDGRTGLYATACRANHSCLLEPQDGPFHTWVLAFFALRPRARLSVDADGGVRPLGDSARWARLDRSSEDCCLDQHFGWRGGHSALSSAALFTNILLKPCSTGRTCQSQISSSLRRSAGRWRWNNDLVASISRSRARKLLSQTWGFLCTCQRHGSAAHVPFVLAHYVTMVPDARCPMTDELIRVLHVRFPAV